MKLKKYLLYSFLLGVVFSANAQKKIDEQAHRGGMGLNPENTIPAMKTALDLHTTLEMDLYLTKDNQIIVSHDDHISSIFALGPNGEVITKADEKKYFLGKMDYSDIKKFDVGSKPYPAFPNQKKMVVHIPLFSVLIDSVEAYAKTKKYRAPRYDIEAKSTKLTRAVPGYNEAFIKGMMKVVKDKKISKRVQVQSFDPDMLEILKRDYPRIETAFLVSKGDLETNLKRLTFKPDNYSALYTMIDKDLVEQCHKKGIRVIAWTPDTKEEIENLKALGVDAIITNYPNLYR